MATATHGIQRPAAGKVPTSQGASEYSVETAQREKGARGTRNAPFMTPHILGSGSLNAALMRLPALKARKREKKYV